MVGSSDFAAISLMYCFFLGIPLLLLFFWTSGELGRTTRQLRAQRVKSLHNGLQTAKDLFELAKLHHVRVLTTQEKSSDYYDSIEKAICLSEETALEPTLAATGIVAHEVGHALQDKEHYWLMRRSHSILRLNNFAGNVTFPVFATGAFLELIELMLLSCILFVVSTVCNILLFCLHRDASGLLAKFCNELIQECC